MPALLPIVNKARKPKFELHLTIYDLNNVPLVSGTSQIKWHLPHSIHGEHRGRTHKCPIDSTNHRVSYNYSKVVPLRISIDRNNTLSECPIEFEVVQEFPTIPGGRDEKITLGVVKLNLSEYVGESENFPRRSIGSKNRVSLEHAREKILGPALQGQRRKNSSSQKNPPPSPSSAGLSVSENGIEEDPAEEGIVRRYLMQESKINSTLKLGILMIQLDGDRNYIAPPLKSAPTFGGIAGIMAEAAEPVEEALASGAGLTFTSANKSRDVSELQDMYCRSLAASWSCQPGELPADECIEDIFSGGDGWKDSDFGGGHRKHHHRDTSSHSGISSSTSGSEEAGRGGTLRPSDMRRMREHISHKPRHRSHRRHPSNTSDHSLTTVLGPRDLMDHSDRNTRHRSRLDESLTSTDNLENLHSRNESLTSLAPTLGSSDRGGAEGSTSSGERFGIIKRGEVGEFEVRDDMVCWALPRASAVGATY
ncbi:N-terminal C2 in EEIG1 and EHBP1 proteins-domain-containing protein [Xylariales sp. PMI_506]|nr:N-terminal C2 in EEIG1 and EHBP1 proteins-domain-containing protein [Xylariales sp. PMI_506]